jgi:hypothetical protein
MALSWLVMLLVRQEAGLSCFLSDKKSIDKAK